MQKEPQDSQAADAAMQEPGQAPEQEPVQPSQASGQEAAQPSQALEQEPAQPSQALEQEPAHPSQAPGQEPEQEPAQPSQGEMPFAVVEGKPVLQLPLDLYIPPDALEVILEAFEGPLDLLLYLIRRQNLDILDIKVAEITRQY
ncbi:MAG: hypothetical protein ACR2PJ_01185, partial [Pseudomonadales bacterium]